MRLKMNIKPETTSVNNLEKLMMKYSTDKYSFISLYRNSPSIEYISRFTGNIKNLLEDSVDSEYYISRMYQYVDIVVPGEHVTHAWHKFVMRVPERNRLQQHLKEHRVDTRIHYSTPLSDLGVVPAPEDELRESHQFSRDALSLPIYPELTDLEVEHIASTVTNYYKNY